MLQTEAATEREIDRSFDQTALHIHGKEECPECPTCDAIAYRARYRQAEYLKEVVGSDDEPEHANDLNATRMSRTTFLEHLRRPFDRHVSPAILEQRILDLEAERDAALLRIKQFEELTAFLSQSFDRQAELLDRLNVYLQDLRQMASLPNPQHLRPAA